MSGAPVDRLAAFVAQLDAERESRGALPEVEVSCDFSCKLQLHAAKAERKVQTVPGVFAGAALAPFKSIAGVFQGKKDGTEGAEGKSSLPVLQNVRASFRPGSLTLVLAPPGHGKSSLLKSIAGVNPLPIEGEIKYCGLTKEQLEEKGISLNRLCEYVTQLDEHLPFLTVKETIKFSHENACKVPDDDVGKAGYEEKVDKVIQLLNLDGCKDTIIGNDLIRGVSGGEKKRVTIAEALVKNAQVLCMDEISTGLDAAVTYNIIAGLKQWSQKTGGTCIAALLQPTPEVVSLFDDVLLLKEGAPVYHGPMDRVKDHFSSLGYVPPDAKSGEDLADWLISLLVSQRRASTRLASKLPRTFRRVFKRWLMRGERRQPMKAAFKQRVGQTALN